MTNTCGANQVQDFLQVANTGTSSVKLSDISMKFWVDDTTGQNLVGQIATGGCVKSGSSCGHQVSGVTISATRFSTACGPDATHQANWEVTISNTDSTLLAAGGTWTNIQAALRLANSAGFSPGTVDWYSHCLAGSTYSFDSHFAVYDAGSLVTTSPGVPPSCRATHGSMTLTGHVPAGLGTTYPLVGPLPSSTQVSLAISLPLTSQPGQPTVQAFIDQVSDPHSASYRQYKTPTTFAAAFGPSTSDYSNLQTFVTSSGLTVSKTYTSRSLLSVKGTAAAVEKALFVTLNQYKRPNGTTFYAPANDPSANVTLTNPILHISGMDNLAVPTPAGGTSSQNCVGMKGYYGVDLRNLYLGTQGSALWGQGQTVALVALDDFSRADINLYQSGTGLGAPLNTASTGASAFPNNISQVLVDQFGTVTTGTYAQDLFPLGPELPGSEAETELGIEMALAMAPQANIVVYEQDTTGLTYFMPATLFGAMTENVPGTTRQPAVIANSWTWVPSTNDATLGQIFAQFASQGQAFFQAAGDVGSYVTGGAVASVPAPIIYSASMTVVGGTSFQGTPPVEAAWNDPAERPTSAVVNGKTISCLVVPLSTDVINSGVCNSAGGGGLVSAVPIPTKQININPSNPDIPTGNQSRMIPDVSMISDNLATVTRAGGTTAVPGCSQGTSASAVLWAGLAALANQHAGSAGNVGFANPQLYELASAGSSAFNDIASGNNSYAGGTGYTARTGYDLATGLGSPSKSDAFVLGLAVTCATGQTLCPGNVCRDLQTDNNNCGACNKVCASGTTCSVGVCAASCTANTLTCSGSQPEVCTNGVWQPSGPACAACSPCTGGACVSNCPPPADNCHTAGSCIQTSGTCSNPVAAGANCPAGSPACQAWYPDCDRDGFGDSQGIPVYSCAAPTVVPTCPAGLSGTYVATNGDCCDKDVNAHPGQTAYFVAADACNSFDYNCDNAQTPQNNGPTDCIPPDAVCAQVPGCPLPTLPADCNASGMENFPTTTCGAPTEIVYQTCAQAGPECVMVGGSDVRGPQACQ